MNQLLECRTVMSSDMWKTLFNPRESLLFSKEASCDLDGLDVAFDSLSSKTLFERNNENLVYISAAFPVYCKFTAV